MNSSQSLVCVGKGKYITIPTWNQGKQTTFSSCHKNAECASHINSKFPSHKDPFWPKNPIFWETKPPKGSDYNRFERVDFSLCSRLHQLNSSLGVGDAPHYTQDHFFRVKILRQRSSNYFVSFGTPRARRIPDGLKVFRQMVSVRFESLHFTKNSPLKGTTWFPLCAVDCECIKLIPWIGRHFVHSTVDSLLGKAIRKPFKR